MRNSSTRQRNIYLLLLLSIWLAGCVGKEIRDDAVKTVVIHPERGKIAHREDNYRLAGRLSVNDARRKFSAAISWRHRVNEDQIYLFTPLGQTIARIDRDTVGVRLVTAEPAFYRAENIEQLTQQVLGLALPVSGLQFWVRGLHFPGTVAELDLDRDGRIVAIRQDGWRILYSAFFPALAGMPELPKLLELDRDHLKIKLVIDRWLDN
ncbi:MAG: lipoprotein insertase outer membrane protein LolB [Nitrosomonas sp.]|nr:lipoprotein insertase outer membrane protein LolB [Nitrosomonas sp.]